MSHARAGSAGSRPAAVIYCRISEDREGRELGVGRQEEDCRELCERHGWAVSSIYIDNDLGASTRTRKGKPRKGYEEMLTAVAAGQAQVIVSYTNSRLTRRPLELERLIVLHEQTGVLISTVRSGTDDLSTADGRMVARIKASVDAAEAERTAERVERAARQRREEGRLHGGPKIFGYVHPTPKNGVRYCQVIDEPAAEAIRDGIEIILSGGKLMDVARQWNVRGLKTTHGKDWLLPDTVAKALSSPRIAGFTAHRGEIVALGNWPAIIDRSTHDDIVAALKTDGSHSGKTARKYLLSGVVFCAACGSKMRSQVGSDQDRYLCDKQRGGCGTVSRSRPWLEEAVRGYVAGRIEEEHQGDHDLTDGEGAVIEAEINAKEEQIARLRDSYQAGVFTMEEVSENVLPLRNEIQRLRAEQGKIVKSQKRREMTTGEALAIWLSSDPNLFLQRRDLLLQHVQRVMVKPLGRGLWGIKDPIPTESIAIVPVR